MIKHHKEMVQEAELEIPLNGRQEAAHLWLSAKHNFTLAISERWRVRTHLWKPLDMPKDLF